MEILAAKLRLWHDASGLKKANISNAMASAKFTDLDLMDLEDFLEA